MVVQRDKAMCNNIDDGISQVKLVKPISEVNPKEMCLESRLFWRIPDPQKMLKNFVGCFGRLETK